MEILFSKILSKTDVKYRLSMTSKSLRNFPKFDGGRHVQVLRVQDYDGGSKIWRFRLMIRRKGKYKKPVLSSTEWLKFVKSKKLQIGDQVQFLKEREYNNVEAAAAADNYINEVKYMVKVMKPVILFKAVIGYAPLSVAIN